MPLAPFPDARFRRTRKSAALRDLVRENTLTPGDFIWPIFLRDGEGIEEPVPSMPGVVRRSVDLVAQAERAPRRPMPWAFRRSASFPIPTRASRPRIAPRPGTPRTCRTAPRGRSRRRCRKWW